MAINWSVDSAVNQIRPAGHKFQSAVNIDSSGASNHTVTGIPDDAGEVCIHLINHSLDNSGSGQCNLRLGYGSVDSGNYYWWATCDGGGTNTTQQGNATNKFELMTSNHTSAAHRVSGTIRLVRATHSEGRSYSGWIMSTQLGDHNNQLFFTSAGYYGITGPIDRVYLFNSAGRGYDSGGRMIVTYATGNY